MLYYIIISILVVEFIYNMTLTALNRKASHNPIPEELSGIYDEVAYKRQQSYSRENSRVGVIAESVEAIVMLAVFCLGGFALLDSYTLSLTTNIVLRALIFFGAFYVIDTVLSVPFTAYSTFSIEQRYGFNRQTPLLFITDTLKGMAISLILYVIMIGVVVEVYSLIPEWFWFIAWAILSLFTLGIQYIYSDLIVPLFNKQTPLEDGELRTAIEEFARKVDFKLQNIYVIDGSKRSSKANAYFTGFGARKRVVLYDTLMEQLTTDEIVAVLAHEIGHYKHRHIIKGTATALLSNLVLFWLFSLVIDSEAIAAAAGCQDPSFHVNMTVFMLLLTPLQIVLGAIGNVVSRRHEWQADEFARVHGFGASLISALRKMSAKSLSNLTPHPFVVFTQYSHPTLLQRLRHCL